MQAAALPNAVYKRLVNSDERFNSTYLSNANVEKIMLIEKSV